ncbi:NADPH:quinone reductase [Subtercola sp. PAMC28395]|uniref:NADPH:quinone reductase n=1 Tax=Subtercola sp. PAMC28395 TaxID=2846775 RepID=UPI001C0B7580|nr:NADPH:quinone reductase [Subtercola sp. PAMC28395]QWT24103.1 NADPH:quinone reductase [Subtercola sp. PAMC28395]
MRAIVYSKPGTADVLQLVEQETPPVGHGEVRVRIVVSGVNPTDWKSRAGSSGVAHFDPPQVPGQDGAGIVDAIGDGVSRVAVGDRVWLRDAAFKRPTGTSADYVVLPQLLVNDLPPGVSFDVGASLGIPALTAHRALTAREGGPERLAPATLVGQTVLVAGGAGAVGHAAIQLAAWAGATVITTVSSDAKADLAWRAGAKHVINYRDENLIARVQELAPRGVDVIVEVNPLANLAADVEVLATGGTIAIYVSGDPDGVVVPARASMTKNVRYQFILTYTTSEVQKGNAVAAVTAAAADGALGVGEENGLPIIRFALEETAEAHRAVEGGFVGKVLIDVQPPGAGRQTLADGQSVMAPDGDAW